MNATQSDWLALVGRITVAILFLQNALGWITGGLDGPIKGAATMGVPVANIAVPLALAILIVGSLSVLLGFYMRLGALALALFTLLAFVFFHRYWEKPEAAMATDRIHFFKDLALTGCLLFMAAFGPGRLSIDARRA
ncbi:MAG TPA: DoxX family protein [Rhizomicrobium sp.]|jgi:putative oxidoreductase|nr:DoxX family protein [Rhizomicrobium sp.]